MSCALRVLFFHLILIKKKKTFFHFTFQEIKKTKPKTADVTEEKKAADPRLGGRL